MVAEVGPDLVLRTPPLAPRAAPKTLQKRNLDFFMHFGCVLAHFWLPFGCRWLPFGSLRLGLPTHYSPPMSQKPADFSIILCRCWFTSVSRLVPVGSLFGSIWLTSCACYSPPMSLKLADFSLPIYPLFVAWDMGRGEGNLNAGTQRVGGFAYLFRQRDCGRTSERVRTNEA